MKILLPYGNKSVKRVNNQKRTQIASNCDFGRNLKITIVGTAYNERWE